jgi:hypothetical protein
MQFEIHKKMMSNAIAHQNGVRFFTSKLIMMLLIIALQLYIATYRAVRQTNGMKLLNGVANYSAHKMLFEFGLDIR